MCITSNIFKAQSYRLLESHLFFFMMDSNGRRKSFWKLKLANSPFSKNFIDNCRRESTAKKAMSSLGLQPTCNTTRGLWYWDEFVFVFLNKRKHIDGLGEDDAISNLTVCQTVCSLLYQKKKMSASLAHCERNPPLTSGFPSQRATNAGSVSISWCHVFVTCIASYKLIPHILQGLPCWSGLQWLARYVTTVDGYVPCYSRRSRRSSGDWTYVDDWGWPTHP